MSTANGAETTRQLRRKLFKLHESRARGFSINFVVYGIFAGLMLCGAIDVIPPKVLGWCMAASATISLCSSIHHNRQADKYEDD